MGFRCEAGVERPNILVIYSDDHGWADLGAQEVNAEVRTPNMDQLAKDGVRFIRGYVSAPQCVPSRAGLLSGRYQQRFGVEDNLKGPLPLSEITIAERLKKAGYVTGQVGKWHLDLVNGGGDKKDLRVDAAHFPNAQGFDEYWRGELKQFYASHDLAGNAFADAPHLVRDDRFRVLVQTEAALSFLDRRVQKEPLPWFLYLAWYAPHVPLDAVEPWFSKTAKDLPKERRMALSMIAAMDDGLGKIRSKLKEMGQEKNTLIFFISDNGAPLGGAWNGSLNMPMRGQKGMLSEGGIRVPFVAAWPGTIPSGQVYDRPVISLDVAATAVALAGQPVDPSLDGVNLMPYVLGENRGEPHESLFWRWGSQAAVLEYPYKLMLLGERAKMLFDVTTPEGENHGRNLMGQKPEVAERLQKKLMAWASELKPPGLPTGLDKHHETLFSEHEIAMKAEAKLTETVAGGTLGWLCRNGELAIKDGALVVKPDANAAVNARVFIANTSVGVQGPCRMVLRLRGGVGGRGMVTWRTKSASFEPQQSVSFEWPSAGEWQEITLDLPEKDRIEHLRITPPKTVGTWEFRSVVLRGVGGTDRVWDFSSGR